MNILVVEDQPFTREMMVSLADAAFPGATVRTADDLDGALSTATNMADLEMVLLDLGLPDSEGLDGLLCFRADFPRAKIVIVSSQDTPELIADALNVGASGYIPKNSGIPVMIAALRLVAQGGVYQPPGFTRPPRQSDAGA